MRTTEELNKDTSLKVIMHNDLIRSKSTLSLNETKLLRLAIMQILKDDTDFKTYQVPIMDLADVMNLDKRNLYRDIDAMTTHLLQEIVYVGDGNPHHKWQKFQWVSSCRYADGLLTIRLHDDLKPYLLELKGLYTQYILEDVLLLKSVYAVRIYELIREKLKGPTPYGDQVATIHLGMDEIRKATDTEGKYVRYSSFKAKVIEKTQTEINSRLSIHVEFKPTKRSRKITGYDVEIMSLARWMCRGKKEKGELNSYET